MSAAVLDIGTKLKNHAGLKDDHGKSDLEKRIARIGTERGINIWKPDVSILYFAGILRTYDIHRDEHQPLSHEILHDVAQEVLAEGDRADLEKLVLEQKDMRKANILFMHALGERVRRELGWTSDQDRERAYLRFGRDAFEIMKNYMPVKYRLMSFLPIDLLTEQFASVNKDFNEVTDACVLGRKEINDKVVYVSERALRPAYLSWLTMDCGFNPEVLEDREILSTMFENEWLMNVGAIEGVGIAIKKTWTKVDSLSGLREQDDDYARTVVPTVEAIIADPLYHFKRTARLRRGKQPTPLLERVSEGYDQQFKWIQELFPGLVFTYQVIVTDRERSKYRRGDRDRAFLELQLEQERASQRLAVQLSRARTALRDIYQTFLHSQYGVEDSQTRAALEEGLAHDDFGTLAETTARLVAALHQKTEVVRQYADQLKRDAAGAALRRKLAHDLKGLPAEIELLTLPLYYRTVYHSFDQIGTAAVLLDDIKAKAVYTLILENVISALHDQGNSELARRLDHERSSYATSLVAKESSGDSERHCYYPHPEDTSVVDPLIAAVTSDVEIMLEVLEKIEVFQAGHSLPQLQSAFEVVHAAVESHYQLRDKLRDAEGVITRGTRADPREMMEVKPLSLDTLVRTAADAVGLQYDVDMIYDSRRNESTTVYGDEISLRVSCLRTLFDNFAEHAAKGDEKKLYVSWEETDDNVVLMIKGTGPAIPETLDVQSYGEAKTLSRQQFLEYLNTGISFTSKTSSDGKRGNGLGMVQIKYVMEDMHCGKITYSINDSGTLTAELQFKQ